MAAGRIREVVAVERDAVVSGGRDDLLCAPPWRCSSSRAHQPMPPAVPLSIHRVLRHRPGNHPGREHDLIRTPAHQREPLPELGQHTIDW